MDPEREDYADRDLPPPRKLPDWLLEIVGIVVCLGSVITITVLLSRLRAH